MKGGWRTRAVTSERLAASCLWHQIPSILQMFLVGSNFRISLTRGALLNISPQM